MKYVAEPASKEGALHESFTSGGTYIVEVKPEFLKHFLSSGECFSLFSCHTYNLKFMYFEDLLAVNKKKKKKKKKKTVRDGNVSWFFHSAQPTMSNLKLTTMAEILTAMLKQIII